MENSKLSRQENNSLGEKGKRLKKILVAERMYQTGQKWRDRKKWEID